jgi:hypothetical protein
MRFPRQQTDPFDTINAERLRRLSPLDLFYSLPSFQWMPQLVASRWLLKLDKPAKTPSHAQPSTLQCTAMFFGLQCVVTNMLVSLNSADGRNAADFVGTLNLSESQTQEQKWVALLNKGRLNGVRFEVASSSASPTTTILTATDPAATTIVVTSFSRLRNFGHVVKDNWLPICHALHADWVSGFRSRPSTPNVLLLVRIQTVLLTISTCLQIIFLLPCVSGKTTL